MKGFQPLGNEWGEVTGGRWVEDVLADDDEGDAKDEDGNRRLADKESGGAENDGRRLMKPCMWMI